MLNKIKIGTKFPSFYYVKKTNALFQRKRHPLKKLIRKIPQISLEQLLIRLLFDKVVGLELAVNFVNFFRTILSRTTAACGP